MKKKDLERNLDNLIIDGLIKEAEQDDADFEAAMRMMSDEMFDNLIYERDCEPAFDDDFDQAHVTYTEYNCCSSYISPLDRSPFTKMRIHIEEPEVAESNVPEPEMAEPELAESDMSSHSIEFPPMAFDYNPPERSLNPWIISALAAVAVLLVILIPSYNFMSGKLCDSALYASSAYITSSRSADAINSLSDADLNDRLPELEQRYKACITEQGSVTHYSDNLQEAGWDLAIAYLKLHKKHDAVEVLTVLSREYASTPFGAHCKALLDQLKLSAF